MFYLYLYTYVFGLTIRAQEVCLLYQLLMNFVFAYDICVVIVCTLLGNNY